MGQRQRNGLIAGMAVVALAVVAAGPSLLAQKVTPASTAAQFTGTWVINRELSPQFAAPPSSPAAAPAFAIAPMFQRGRGGGGGGFTPTLTAEDRAGMAAIQELQQVASTIQITATPDSIAFTDPRGTRTYPVNNKNEAIEMNGATINTKSRWDKQTLKQEFVSGESTLTHTWELKNKGTRLNFKWQLLNMNNPSAYREAKAVYDKKQ